MSVDKIGNDEFVAKITSFSMGRSFTKDIYGIRLYFTKVAFSFRPPIKPFTNSDLPFQHRDVRARLPHPGRRRPGPARLAVRHQPAPRRPDPLHVRPGPPARPRPAQRRAASAGVGGGRQLRPASSPSPTP
jgi:hypothetical protein